MIRNNEKINLGRLGMVILVFVFMYVAFQLTLGSGIVVAKLP